MNTYNLQRFIEAQDHEGTFDRALSELRGGRKTTDWMWFVFPQHVALGQSETSRRYGIAGPTEATAYLNHPILGPRLIRATQTVLGLTNRPPRDVFGFVDEQKFHACLTLFAHVSTDPEHPFDRTLQRFFAGGPHDETMQQLDKLDSGSDCLGPTNMLTPPPRGNLNPGSERPGS